MSYGNVGFKTHIAWVKTSFIEVTHNATPIQILFADCLLVSDEGKSVNDDGQNKGKEYLENEHNIHILENLEEIDWSYLPTCFQEQVTHKSTYCFISGHKHKTKALPQGVTVTQSLLFEVEEHENTKEVLHQNKRNNG